MQLLRRQGYRATSVNDFLEAADASNGSLYHHFPEGKEELAKVAIESAGQIVRDALEQALDASEDVGVAAQHWIDQLIEGLQADPRDGCPVAPTALEASSVSEPLRETAAQVFSGWARTFEKALARDRDPEVARAQAQVILSAIEGALLLDRTSQGTANLRALRQALPAMLSQTG